jgi:hypothetical protein
MRNITVARQTRCINPPSASQSHNLILWSTAGLTVQE